MPQRIVVEICAATAQDAILSAGWGASRIELNSALGLGGLTPSLAALIDVRTETNCPIIAMARPRDGGFCYDARDFSQLQHEIDLLLDHGADGIAVGLLTRQQQIDVDRCRRLTQQVLPRQLVFHRAFDLVADWSIALNQLVDLGWTRILTSGGQRTAEMGADRIRQLHRLAADRIEILPGGGIRAHNVAQLIRQTGCWQVHASASAIDSDGSISPAPPEKQLRFDSPPLEQPAQFRRVSNDQVRDLVETVRQLDR